MSDTLPMAIPESALLCPKCYESLAPGVTTKVFLERLPNADGLYCPQCFREVKTPGEEVRQAGETDVRSRHEQQSNPVAGSLDREVGSPVASPVDRASGRRT